MPNPSLMNQYRVILNYSLSVPKPDGFYTHNNNLVMFYHQKPILISDQV